MARRRGFFAELQHQNAVAERNRQRDQAAAVRNQQRVYRAAEQAQAAAQRAQEKAARSDAKSQAEAARESKRLHIEARELEVESLNTQLEMRLHDIDTILQATLSVDDYVDLEALRKHVENPPFTSANSRAIPPPPRLAPSREPVFVPPPGPTGLFGKKKHAEAVAAAEQSHRTAHKNWQRKADNIPRQQQALDDQHRLDEQQRLSHLRREQAAYEEQCGERAKQVDRDNAELDDLIREFNAGTQDGVEEYFSIVLSNSVYPDGVELGIEFDIDVVNAELTICMDIPRPDELPTERQYKYVKAKDEIATVAQSQKELRERYAGMLSSLALRTLHELWEADRGAKIATIAMTAGVGHVDPATGRDTRTLLLAVAVERNEFLALNLANVTPAETLRHLGANVSKNPWALAPIENTTGVRGR